MDFGKQGNIVWICDNPDCKEFWVMSKIHELSCLSRSTVMVCMACGHKHTNLDELKDYSRQTRTYHQS